MGCSTDPNNNTGKLRDRAALSRTPNVPLLRTAFQTHWAVRTYWSNARTPRHRCWTLLGRGRLWAGQAGPKEVGRPRAAKGVPVRNVIQLAGPCGTQLAAACLTQLVSWLGPQGSPRANLPSLPHLESGQYPPDQGHTGAPEASRAGGYSQTQVPNIQPPYGAYGACLGSPRSSSSTVQDA